MTDSTTTTTLIARQEKNKTKKKKASKKRKADRDEEDVTRLRGTLAQHLTRFFHEIKTDGMFHDGDGQPNWSIESRQGTLATITIKRPVGRPPTRKRAKIAAKAEAAAAATAVPKSAFGQAVDFLSKGVMPTGIPSGKDLEMTNKFFKD